MKTNTPFARLFVLLLWAALFGVSLHTSSAQCVPANQDASATGSFTSGSGATVNYTITYGGGAYLLNTSGQPTICGFTFPNNIAFTGNTGPGSVTYTFDKALTALDLVQYGNSTVANNQGETAFYTTNAGANPTLSITTEGTCPGVHSVSGNSIVGTNQAGNVQIKVSSATPFTVLTISEPNAGVNNNGGLAFGLCGVGATLAAAATPVATGTQNPTSPGTSTGIINLTATTGQTPYPASTPVSVTYTTPTNMSAVFTGSTDGTGKITIPNLPAGTYGPFKVSVNGGPTSNPSNQVTLVDPVVPAPATPVASVTQNPTSPGTSTGIINLTATAGQTPYPASTPVSVTYTPPGGGTPVVFTGTTDGTGKIIIPNLPAGTYGPFVVSVNGGPPSSPSNTVTLVDPVVPAAATPVASVVQNPTTAGSSTGIISLTATAGQTPYPNNTAVSVTYTTPGGGSATFTGTTNGTGQIIIPNLPAGTYGPFVVRVNGGPASSPSNTVTLVDPTPACAANAGTITRQ